MRVSYPYPTCHLAHIDLSPLDTRTEEVEFSLTVGDFSFPQQQMLSRISKQKEAYTQQLHF